MRGVRGTKLIGAIVVSVIALGSGIALAAQATSENTAATTDERVELIDQRTETSKTFQLADGARELQVFETPINYRDEAGG